MTTAQDHKKSEIKKWYARKTSYGISRVVHAILHDEERNIDRIVCNPGGAFKPGGLAYVAGIEGRDPRICPECITAVAELVGKRLTDKK